MGKGKVNTLEGLTTLENIVLCTEGLGALIICMGNLTAYYGFRHDAFSCGIHVSQEDGGSNQGLCSLLIGHVKSCVTSGISRLLGARAL